jgi:hypothetical protein
LPIIAARTWRLDLTTSFDQFWRSPNFTGWLTLAAAGFFAIVLLITLLRADRSVANGALTVISLLAIGVAAAATVRGFSPGGRNSSANAQSLAATVSLPALSCIDDLAGETALTACEKILFGSPDSAAAAVAYASNLITRLTALGDVAAANGAMTPEVHALRRSVERDRYGLMAYVLSVRDRCQPGDCAAYKSLTDHNQIAANMDERVYEAAIIRHAPSWAALPATAPPATSAPAIATLAPSAPTGKPTNAEFPSATSIPAVNIMTPEPSASSPARAPAPAVTAPPPQSRPAPALSAAPSPAAAKKPAAPKRAAVSAPVQLAPAPAPAAEPASAAAEE